MKLMKKYIYKIGKVRPLIKLALLTLLLVFHSCESDLDVGLPPSQLTGITVFDDPATARAALAEIYAQLRDQVLVSGNPSGVGILMGLYADELDFYGGSPGTEMSFYNHTVLPTDGGISAFWNDSYHLIYEANAILEGLAVSTSLTEEEKKPFIGEALFLRAYIHFYLENIFGAIPYITTTDYHINAVVSRESTQEVIGQIVSDLLKSNAFLPEAGVVPDRTLITQGVSHAFLARVYLYAEQWEAAAAEADWVVDNGTYNWQEDLSQVFLSGSPSTIWQLIPSEGNVTAEAQVFIFEAGPPPYVALNEGLVNSFEAEDLRRQQWIAEVPGDLESWYYANKYKVNYPDGGAPEYSILMRLAEIYLIRAEARSHLGDIGGAQSDLNKVRQRAGLEDTQADTETALIDAIIQERFHELFTEQGHRWFDIKRTDRAADVLQPIKIGWRITDELLPLPEEELRLNPHLKPQNPGY